MHQTQGTFQGADNLPLFYQSWQPQGEARAIVAIVHGFGEHSGRHETIARPLVAAGYAVFAYDQRGHGHSPGKRGYINQWREFREDLAAFLNLLRQENGSRPLFLFGHSMGGLVVLEYTLHHTHNLAGVIASSPFLAEANLPAYLHTISRVLSRLWPGLNVSTGMDYSGISRDPAEVTRYAEDPLNHSSGTPRLGTEITAAIAWTQAHAPEWKIPLYIYHCTADKVIPIAGSRTFFSHVNAPDKQWREFEGGYHELHHDPCREEVFRYLREWLNAHS